MKLYIGTNFGHGSSAAAIDDEANLVFAVEEGRLIQSKDCDAFPENAIEFLIESFEPSEVHWAEGWDRWKRFAHKGLGTTLSYALWDFSYIRSRLVKETGRLLTGISLERRFHRRLNKLEFTGHHLAHAYSVLPWGLPKRSLVLVSDTTAEMMSVSVFYWDGAYMREILKVPYPHSPGLAFHQMAVQLGFRGRTAPGKLMALSAYGQPIWMEELKSICSIDKSGFRFELKKYPAWHRRSAWSRFMHNSASASLRRAFYSKNEDAGARRDLARSTQDWFTFVTLSIIEHALALTRKWEGHDVKHLALAGGAALNCHTNGHIVRKKEKFGLESVIVSPWSDDAGTAIGAAAWVFHSTTKRIPMTVNRCPFLGPPLDRITERKSPRDTDVLCAVDAILSGGVVGLVSGRLEFGPRALGGRCLLADARSTIVRDKLNDIKGRPRFMPFAPVVLKRDFVAYFRDEGSDIMAWTVRSTGTALRDIPGAVHANGEARVQVLPESSESLLARVLKSFRDKTGIGVLLLTSLNGEREAIASCLEVARDMVKNMPVDGILSDLGWTPNEIELRRVPYSQRRHAQDAA